MDRNSILSCYFYNKYQFEKYVYSQRTYQNVLHEIKHIYDDYIFNLEEINYNNQSTNLISSNELFLFETELNYENCLNDLKTKFKIIDKDNEIIRKKLYNSEKTSNQLFESKNQQHFNSTSLNLQNEINSKIKNSIDIKYLQELLHNLENDYSDLLQNRKEKYLKKNIQETISKDIAKHTHHGIQNENIISKMKEKNSLLKKSIRVAKIYSKLESKTFGLFNYIDREFKNSNDLNFFYINKMDLDEYSSFDLVDICLQKSKYDFLLHMFQSNTLHITKSMIDLIYKSIVVIHNAGIVNFSKTIYYSLLNICCDYYKSIANDNMTIICLLQLSKYNQAVNLTLQHHLYVEDISKICSLIDNEYMIFKYLNKLYGFDKVDDDNILLLLRGNNFKQFNNVIQELCKFNEQKCCLILALIFQKNDINEIMNSTTSKALLQISQICLRNNFESLASDILISYALLNSKKFIKTLKNKE